MKPFTSLAAMFLGVLASMQLLRFVMRWDVSINGMSIPLWISALAFVLAGALALMVWKEHRA